MKNQYVGDIGDYGKYGLLRFLSNHGIIIGINWYLTEDDYFCLVSFNLFNCINGNMLLFH